MLPSDLDHRQTPGESLAEMLTGEIREHLAAHGAEVGGQAPVDVGRNDVLPDRAAEYHGPGLHTGREGEAVELIEIVPGDPLAAGLGDALPLAAAAVVDVGAVVGGGVDGDKVDALVADQVPQQVAGLARQGGAQRHLGAERSEHPCLPDPLTAGVDVDLRITVLRLHRHAEDGGRREDDDVSHARSFRLHLRGLHSV